MIHPLIVAKIARLFKELVRDRIVSFSRYPTSVAQFELIPAPYERTLTRPYPWDRREPTRSPRPARESSRSRDVPSARVRKIEQRAARETQQLAERLRRVEQRAARETRQQAARSRGRCR
jgi:hypothetical protein